MIFSDDATNIPPLSGELMQRWNGRIDSHFHPLDENVKEAFGCDHSFFVILRPDNYIGLVSDNFSPELVGQYLARFH